METPSAGLEPEAYFPPAPDAGGERYWLPATRALAIEWARQARRPIRGLAVDDATLERVADAVMDPAYPPPWLPLTAEEREDLGERGSKDLKRVWEAVNEYLSRHPEINGHVDVGWRDGRQTFFVGIVGDPQPHGSALARIGGERVVLERTDADLRAIEARIRRREPELTAAGLSLIEIWSDPARGVAEVCVVGGRDERAAAEFFAARYGDAVAVRWLGRSRLLELPHPFGSWTSDGRRMRVFFALDPNGQQRGTARVAEENDERIVIALSCLDPVQDFRTLIGGVHRHHAEVQLREPVGARAVIDASVGVVRPSLAQLRSRPDWQPHPAGLGHRAPGAVADELVDIWIEELPLGVRAYNALKRSGVQTVADLARLSAEEVAALPGVGRKGFDEIVDALAALGLSLTRVGKG
jgi:Bacterial RNA polymerase, alpha chain C terminal domain